MKPERIIVVRHAHRDKPKGHAFDNGLSEKGLLQAQALVATLEDVVNSENIDFVSIFSSRKLRCTETLRPWANRVNAEIQEVDWLTESEDVWSRVLEAKSLITSGSPEFQPTLVLCSHGDWIPLFVSVLCGESIDIRKAETVALSLEGRGVWKVTRRVPPPKLSEG
jgi:phosphohistidine phosphatase SixA